MNLINPLGNKGVEDCVKIRLINPTRDACVRIELVKKVCGGYRTFLEIEDYAGGDFMILGTGDIRINGALKALPLEGFTETGRITMCFTQNTHITGIGIGEGNVKSFPYFMDTVEQVFLFKVPVSGFNGQPLPSVKTWAMIENAITQFDMDSILKSLSENSILDGTCVMAGTIRPSSKGWEYVEILENRGWYVSFEEEED